MPAITVEFQKTTKEKKAELVKALTKAASEVLDIPEQGWYVFIHEMEKDSIGVGGKLLSNT